jgi:hypothetical protein
MCGEKVTDRLGSDKPDRRCGRLDTGKHEIPHLHHAEKLTLCVKRGSARKAGHRCRLAQFDCVSANQPRLDFGKLLAAILLLRIRNADQRHLALLGRIRSEAERRRQLACAVNTQQGQAVILVLRDPVGIAQTGGDDNLASSRKVTVSNYVATSAHD